MNPIDLANHINIFLESSGLVYEAFFNIESDGLVIMTIKIANPDKTQEEQYRQLWKNYNG